MDKQNKYNFIYVGFNAHKPPQFKEGRGNQKELILYGTEGKWKNRYPDYLVDLYNRSSKHSAIVDGKVNYICGQGFSCEERDLGKRALVNAFINNAGQDSLRELTKKVASDLVLFGGYYVEPIMNKRGDKIAELNHLPFCHFRRLVDGGYAYTSDWSVRKPEENEDYKVFEDFDPQKVEKNKNYVIAYRCYHPSMGEYSLPEYLGSIPYIESDAEIANYTLNNIKNGFAGTFIINFHNGEPTEDEKDYIEDAIKEKFAGSDNAGSFLLTFDDGGDRSMDVIPINPNGQDDRFLNLNDQVRQEIFTGHGITNPTLFGISSTNGFTNNADEFRVSEEAFKNRYVVDKQSILLDLFNGVLTFNGLNPCLEFVQLEAITETLSEDVLVSIMTVDELREKAGLPPLQQGEVVGFKSEEVDYDLLKIEMMSTGFHDDELEVLHTSIPSIDPFSEDYDFVSEEKKLIFATQTGLGVLDLLRANPGMELSEVAKALGTDLSKVVAEVRALQNEGLLDGLNVQEIPEQPEEEIFVVYKYRERPDALPAKSGSRPFCKTLMSLSNMGRSWTRAQIGAMSNGQGLNVFRSRGGWYTLPGTDTSRPSCRHIFEQRVVRKKK